MSTSRAQKEQEANGLRQDLAGVPHAFLVDFRGLDVANASNLRRKLREGSAGLRVVKNTIALRAFEDMPIGQLSAAFVGQTAIAYTDGDVVIVAKTLREFAKEFETPTFKAGIVDGEPITAEQFEQLAELPSREELIGKALYLMNYPLVGLVTVLTGVLRGAVTVLDQIRQKKEEAGESAPAAGAEQVAAPEPDAAAGPEAAEAAEPEAEAAASPDVEAPAEDTEGSGDEGAAAEGKAVE